MTTRTDTLIAQLDRHSRNLASILRRIERRELTGRNGDATDGSIRMHLHEGRRLVGELCELPEDEAPEALIARPLDRFWSVERRALGLPA